MEKLSCYTFDNIFTWGTKIYRTEQLAKLLQMQFISYTQPHSSREKDCYETTTD